MPAEEYWKQNINLGLFDDPYRYIDESRTKQEVLTAERRKTAREIAAHTFVLLKNNNHGITIKKIRNDRIDRSIGK